jgi:hypothetical protein
MVSCSARLGRWFPEAVCDNNAMGMKLARVCASAGRVVVAQHQPPRARPRFQGCGDRERDL